MGDSGLSCSKSLLVSKEIKIATAREVHELVSSGPSFVTKSRGRGDDVHQQQAADKSPKLPGSDTEAEKEAASLHPAHHE